MPGLNKLKRAFGNIWAMAAVATRKKSPRKKSRRKSFHRKSFAEKKIAEKFEPEKSGDV